jgi:hypothetical protein
MAYILLTCPSLFGYEDRIAKAISNAGHDVIRVDERVGNSFWEKSFTRIGFIRLLARKKRNKVREIETILEEHDIRRLIIISPETLTGEDVAQWKTRYPSLVIVVYNWDSQKQKPVTAAMQKAADVVFSFDPVDCQKNPSFRYLPLFHCWDKPQITSGPKLYDFSFIGSGRIQRIRLLARLQRLIRAEKKTYFFYIFAQSRLHYFLFVLLAKIYRFRGTISWQKIDYASFLKVTSETRCVIDIEHQRQRGLTMRTIETVFSGRAIATTNAEIAHHDFFKGDATFVLDRNNLKLPPLPKREHRIDDGLFWKYGIANWVSQILAPEVGLDETHILGARGQIE